jgi:predicted patatin/cPLA2 family phospholipase
VILTKEVGYVRKPATKIGLLKVRYRKYPKLVEAMQKRHIAYNETLEYLERLEESKKAFIIRPKKASDVGRLDKDPKKLQALYEEGYADAAACHEELVKFLMA